MSKFILKTLAFIFVFIGCKSEPQIVSPNHFLAWVENHENEFILNKEFDGLVYSAFYKPPKYIAYKECISHNCIDSLKLKKRINGLSNQYNFGFRIKSKDGNHILNTRSQNQNEYFQRLEYFLTAAKKDFKLLLLSSKDTLDCSIYHFERNYGAAPFIDISLAFQNPLGTNIEDITLQFEDQIFENGSIKFNYEKDNIQNLPQIQ